MKINSLLAATLAFVLVAGLGTPAFAGVAPFDGEKNTVWVDCFVVAGGSGECSLTVGPSEFELDSVSATWSCQTLNNADVNNGPEPDCVVIVPNFIDPLPLKLIHITTDFAEVVAIDCFDDDGSNGVIIVAGSRDSQIPNGDGFIEEWRCEPNPDTEDIFFRLTTNEVSNIEIHTVSKDVPPRPPVGGGIIPIEQTSLLLAGAQTFSWMIPVVLSVLGIGLFVFRKSENS